MNIEEQMKYDMMQLLAGVFYTFFVFVCGFLFALAIPLLTPKVKPTNYILPDAPASGMYVSNKFSF